MSGRQTRRGRRLIIAVAHIAVTSTPIVVLISSSSPAHPSTYTHTHFTVRVTHIADGVRLLPSRDQDEVSHHRVPSIAADLHGGNRACAGQDQRRQNMLSLGVLENAEENAEHRNDDDDDDDVKEGGQRRP